MDEFKVGDKVIVLRWSYFGDFWEEDIITKVEKDKITFSSGNWSNLENVKQWQKDYKTLTEIQKTIKHRGSYDAS